MGYCRVVMEQLQYQHIYRHLFKSRKSHSVECCGRNAVITGASDASENSSEGHCEGKRSMQRQATVRGKAVWASGYWWVNAWVVSRWRCKEWSGGLQVGECCLGSWLPEKHRGAWWGCRR
jgi:hypothetical protein